MEQRDQPELRGRPVVVGGARARGVVAAASYEARRFGVRSAMPAATALRKCPELVFVKPRFEVYKEVSRQIRAIFAEYTPLIEPLSLDEAYLDVTENLKGLPLASEVARQIRADILRQTQLTASAGISYNKFLAKLASDYRKPNGQFVIRPEQGLAFVEQLRVGEFHGIGPATAGRLNQLGIFSGLDLRQQSETFLRQHFGKAGGHYYLIARAQDPRPVRPDRVRKSIGSETTFEHDLTSYDDLWARLLPCLDHHLGPRRAPGRARPYAHAQNQVRRLPANHPQPHALRPPAPPRPGPAPSPGAAPGPAPPAPGRAPARHHPLQPRKPRGFRWASS